MQSTTYKQIAAALEGHQHADALTETLKAYDSEASEFHETDNGDQLNCDLAEAVYWISYLWHGGQDCPLYAAGCATDFTPGMGSNGVETGGEAEMIYKELEAILED